MSQTWEQLNIISPGGTVFQVAADSAGRTWLATGAGIFFQKGDTFTSLPQGQPLPQLNALAWAGNRLLAGGGQGQIVYSPDEGQSWYQGRVGPVNAPITCLAVSPNFEDSGVLLAGTDGAGILRSTDSGRNWQPASFGLTDFGVIALATAPSWGRRELAFAATAHGFYRSPNGGRAWKKSDTGLAGAEIQTLAVSPTFARDRTLLAGTENQGLFRSTDSGKSWQAWGQGITPLAGGDGHSLPPINGLWLHPEFAATPVCLAATGDGQIFYSADGGQRWRQVAAAGSAILCLGGQAGQLVAGLLDEGLLSSTDGGQTWSSDDSLAARAFTRLLSRDQSLLAYGALEPPWHSPDGGATWSALAAPGAGGPLMALAASPPPADPEEARYACLLAATAAGLHYSADEGQSWQTVLEQEELVTICFSPHFAEDGLAWAGTGQGTLLASADGGLTWSNRTAPRPGQPLVALTGLSQPDRAGEFILAAVTFAPDKEQMTLWRSDNGGLDWQQWQQASASWPSAQVSQAGKRFLVSFDRRMWLSAPSGWQRVLETKRPLTRLARLAGDKGLLALTANQLLNSPTGLNWSDLTEGLAGQVLLDLAVGPATEAGQPAYILNTGGVVWRRMFRGKPPA